MGTTSSAVKSGGVVEVIGPPDHVRRFQRDGDAPLDMRQWFMNVLTGRPQEVDRLYNYDEKAKIWDKPECLMNPMPDSFLLMSFAEVKKVFDVSVKQSIPLLEAFIAYRGPNKLVADWIMEAKEGPKVYGTDAEGEEGYRKL